MLKTGSGWIVYFDKYRVHKYGAVRSADLKNWEDISNSIVLPEGARHGTVIEIDEKTLKRLLEI